jgi:hypothetical protein
MRGAELEPEPGIAVVAAALEDGFPPAPSSKA